MTTMVIENEHDMNERKEWTEKDTAFIRHTRDCDKGTVPTSLKEIKDMHESLGY